METNAFASLATLQVPPASRLLPNACCPDKDLFVLVTRAHDKDRLSLWKMQGSKKWEVDVNPEVNNVVIVDVAWSPDGQSIAVAQHPPHVTAHSIQDGRIARKQDVKLPASLVPGAPRVSASLTGIWWYKKEKKEETGVIPDIFKRKGFITGSAHSILRMLPLLDPLKDDTRPLTTADIFAFRGNHSRPAAQRKMPDFISAWPTLPSDLLAASIQPATRAGYMPLRPGEELDVANDANVDSLLVLGDQNGNLHLYLDGTYPLGTVALDSTLSINSLFKNPDKPLFLAHLRTDTPTSLGWNVCAASPIVARFSLLDTRLPRDIAMASSTARELAWYAMCVVREMRSAWFGSESHGGARALGPKWVQSLEAKQKNQFAQEEPNAMLDLTCLLCTGKASEPLTDLLGSGEQMSERGIQKWESTVVEALTKLRDHSEKRLSPACQRLHLVMEEVEGWSRLPAQYRACNIETKAVIACLEAIERAIIISSWLAATARRELSRFKEFIAWIRYETIHVNPSIDTQNAPRHDILEVNNYLMSGLVVSPIDKWFMGPVPKFNPREIGLPGPPRALSEVIKQARQAIDDPQELAWQSNIRTKDLSHLDRNLDSLLQDLSKRCSEIFVKASGATARSANVSYGFGSARIEFDMTQRGYFCGKTIRTRERVIRYENEADQFIQYLAMAVPPTPAIAGRRSFLMLTRMWYGPETAEEPLRMDVALLECCASDESGDGGQIGFDLLDMEFFDDQTLVVLYRLSSTKSTLVGVIDYIGLEYQELNSIAYVNGPAREQLVVDALQWWKSDDERAKLYSVRIPIGRCRELSTDTGERELSVAVNGRVGRRVVCVLDDGGHTVEVLDMEGEEDEAMEADIEGETGR